MSATETHFVFVKKLIYRFYSILVLLGLSLAAQPIVGRVDEQRLRAAGLIPVSSSETSSLSDSVDDSLENVHIGHLRHHDDLPRQPPQAKRSVSRYMNPSFDSSERPDHGRFVHTFGSDSQDYQDRPAVQGRIKLRFRETDMTSNPYPRTPPIESSPSPAAANFLSSLDEQSMLDNELYEGAPAHSPLTMDSFDSAEPSSYPLQRVGPVYGIPYRRLYN